MAGLILSKRTHSQDEVFLARTGQGRHGIVTTNLLPERAARGGSKSSASHGLNSRVAERYLETERVTGGRPISPPPMAKTNLPEGRNFVNPSVDRPGILQGLS